MRKMTCARCGEFKEPERIWAQAYCKSCHATYMRANRPKYSELSDEARKKASVRGYAKEYLKRGVLKREPCEKCGSPDSQFHHEDYDKPLQVTNLCRPCHLELHNNINK